METIGIALLALVVLVVLGGIVCFVFDWINAGLFALYARWRKPKETREQYAARLRNPQFDVIEAHFGGRVPESLRRLYRNVELLQQEGFYLVDLNDADEDTGDFIYQFLPADKAALDDLAWDFGAHFFPFASDGFGNYYGVLIEHGPPDPCPVYFFDHEGSSTLEEMKIADSLDEFLARPRRPLSS